MTSPDPWTWSDWIALACALCVAGALLGSAFVVWCVL